MDDVTCPYCDEEFEVCHDDGAHYKDGESEPDYCPNCNKQVMIYSSCSWYHEASKADCLNDIAPHDWSNWDFLWFNDDYTQKRERRYCQVCDEDEQAWHDVTDVDSERVAQYISWEKEREFNQLPKSPKEDPLQGGK